ncbi:hypothetical protein CAG51_00005, partial [Vibrio sp. V24_P1S3T111]
MYLGFKQSLIVGVLVLTSLALGVVSFITYSNVSSSFREDKIRTVIEYVEAKKETIDSYFLDKVASLEDLSAFYNENPIPQDKVSFVKQLAAAAHVDSVVFTEHSGKAYWNQTNSNWPNHVYESDGTTGEWYKVAIGKKEIAMTEPYDDGGSIWVSIASQVDDGVISFDFELSKLNNMMKSFGELDGAISLLMDSDSTVLAVSSTSLSNGDRAIELNGFSGVIKKTLNSKSSLLQYYELKGKQKIFYSIPINIADSTWFLGVSLEVNKTFAPIYNTRSSSALMVLTGTFITLVLFYLLINKLYQPITSLRELALDLSKGEADLTKRLELGRRDDLGQIADGIDLFIDKVHL